MFLFYVNQESELIAFFSVGWAGFDDYELALDAGDNCKILPPEATPHEPSVGDCNFQHGLCDWEISKPDLFKKKPHLPNS